jgi:uncharacterized DUF497 family protein
MQIEFDPKKNAANKAKHGLDFADIVLLDWENALIWTDDREDYGECRYAALAMNDRLYSVAFTVRDDVFRVISFRKANKREERRYDER